MKNMKKWLSLAMAATMLIGSTSMVLANEGGATGSGNYEGYVEETSAFSVVVPTDASATKGFDFFVDPNGLLAETGYARLEGVTAEDFEEDATLFFTRTAGETLTTYGKDSESITFTNQSSYAVNVEVTASVTGATGIELGAVDESTVAPTIYLALVSTEDDTEVITADGATLTGTIAGTTENFEIQYNEEEEKYEYVAITPEGDDELTWETYSFNLTGACGGTWTDAQAEVAPTVTLTWKVTDPKAVPELPPVPPVTEATISSGAAVVLSGSEDANAGITHTASLVTAADTTIAFSLPSDVSVKNVYVAGSLSGLANNTVNADRAEISDGNVILKGTSDWATAGSGTKYAKVVVGTSEEDTATFIIKITISGS